jgi:hypothetical protein
MERVSPTAWPPAVLTTPLGRPVVPDIPLVHFSYRILYQERGEEGESD